MDKTAFLEKKHQELYNQIPKFDCIQGCTGCCGPIAFSDHEWEKVPEKKIQNPLCTKCPYATDKGCSIYEARPMICRLFGAVDIPALTCSFGKGPKNKLTANQMEKLMRKYYKYGVDYKNVDMEKLRSIHGHDF